MGGEEERKEGRGPARGGRTSGLAAAGESPFSCLFVVPEVIPFAKTGDLADVAHALPKALRRLDCDARVVLPLYRAAREAGVPMELILEGMPVEVGGEWVPADVFLSEIGGGTPCYLLQRDELFDRTYLYGGPKEDYLDNAVRFAFFSKAVFSLCRALEFYPDVLHCHDWQTALVPAYLKFLFGSSPEFSRTGSLLTIHDLGRQGIFPLGQYAKIGLPPEFFSPEGMEFWGNVNFLKGGIVTADLLNTVSPTYREEILTEEYGCGLHGVLAERRDDLYGVLNGADYDEWDPTRDPFLACCYGLDDLGGKRICKAALLKEAGIGTYGRDAPLFGMVSRLTSREGLDLLEAALETLIEMGINLILLGDGREKFRAAFEGLAERFPDAFFFRYGFDAAMVHRLHGGCDFLLMPSRSEPCGLNQIYAMRYGTIPVVRATGGLRDTVTPYDPHSGEGTGFLFEGYEPSAMLGAVWNAIGLFGNPREMEGVRRNCMEACLSAGLSARGYLHLYKRIRRRRGRPAPRPAGPGRGRAAP